MKAIISVMRPPIAEPLSFAKLAIETLFSPRVMFPEPMSVSPVRKCEVLRAAVHNTRVMGLTYSA